MPFGSEGEEEGIALALSGGGYRAMLFHLGALWRMNELGLLGRVNRISSVSGGSLTAGRLAVRWRRLRFEDGVAMNFRDEVADPLLRQSGRWVDAPAAILGLLPFLSAAGVAAFLYRLRLLGRASLQDLPGNPGDPRFVFNATHLNTGTSWRFSRPYMGSYRVGLVRDPKVSLATAVAASAAFPPFLSPLTLSLDPASFERVEGADLYDRAELRKTVSLSDGGVYDNMGLETVWRRYRTVLVSDAGGQLDVAEGRLRFWPKQLRRVLDIAGEQGRALRRRALVADYLAGTKKGTLWRTRTDIRKYPKASPFAVDPDWRFHMAAIRTRLAPFNEEERSRLVNWGYLVSDVALRSYVVPEAPPPLALPFPQYGFASPPPRGRSAAAGDVAEDRRPAPAPAPPPPSP